MHSVWFLNIILSVLTDYTGDIWVPVDMVSDFLVFCCIEWIQPDFFVFLEKFRGPVGPEGQGGITLQPPLKEGFRVHKLEQSLSWINHEQPKKWAKIKITVIKYVLFDKFLERFQLPASW